MIETYTRHSPSSCNLFSSDLAMFVVERVLGRKQPVGAAAHRGTAVEKGVVHGLMSPEVPLIECIEVAMMEYTYLMALSRDLRKEHAAEGIPEMVAQAVTELRQIGIPFATQGVVELFHEDLKLPLYGLFDFAFKLKPLQLQGDDTRIIVDLKTTEKLPSSIRTGHARQVALYAKAMAAEGWITYVTPKKLATYQLENVEEHYQALITIARKIESFLSLSDDPEFYLSITSPNLDSFYWGTPEARQIAYEVFKV